MPGLRSKSVLQQTVVSPHELDLITFVDHYCDRRTMQTFLSRRSLLQLSALAAMSRRKAKAASPRPSRAARPGQTESTGSAPLQTKGLFMHAWDLKDSGADTVMAWMRDSGLNQMTIAGCYHSGWFVHPHNPATSGVHDGRQRRLLSSRQEDFQEFPDQADCGQLREGHKLADGGRQAFGQVSTPDGLLDHRDAQYPPGAEVSSVRATERVR